MSLPRSVKEMSVDLNPPRRCKSDMFKGFSFIQDDFILPDRPDQELNFYWNNLEEDGESASECASTLSKPDDESITNRVVNTSENLADRKRNRKKKKNVLNQTASTNQSTTGTNINSLPLDSTSDRVILQGDTPTLDTAIEPMINSLSGEHASAQILEVDSIAQTMKNTVLEEHASGKPNSSVDDTQTDTNEWETVVKPGKKSHPVPRSLHDHSLTIARQITTPKEHGKLSTHPASNPNIISEKSQVDANRRHQNHLGTVTAMSTNDWREHKIRSPAKVIHTNPHSSPADATSWPGLGDQSQSQSAKSTTSNFTPKGAWASRATTR